METKFREEGGYALYFWKAPWKKRKEVEPQKVREKDEKAKLEGRL
ncbi:hypothetical protein [Thermococcus sp. 2319x1]|nr:hypothetical protein [Thermococcus sp. 2319x1]